MVSQSTWLVLYDYYYYYFSNSMFMDADVMVYTVRLSLHASIECEFSINIRCLKRKDNGFH